MILAVTMERTWLSAGYSCDPVPAGNVPAAARAVSSSSFPLEAFSAICRITFCCAVDCGAAAAAPQSTAQQKVILQMAEKASNGKELLLTARAAAGTFPAGTGSQEYPAESQVRSIVTAKIIELGTLDQLIDYATQYSVNPESARPFVQRMFQLGDRNSDSRVWYRVGVVASRLKLADLERQARARGDQLAGR